MVDDQCTNYLQDLFGWERKRNRVRDTLTLAGASTAAVLGLTNVSTKAIAITAQAFGFAGGAWTILADSYLYKLSPSIISDIELKLQTAYRESAAKSKSEINNGATAYQYIRGYLNLCLPVTIESKVNDYLAQTTASTKKGDTGSAPRAAALSITRSKFAPAAAPAGTAPDVQLRSLR